MKPVNNLHGNVEDLQDTKSVGGVLGATWGRFGGLPAAALIAPTSPTDLLDTMSEREAQKVYEDMRSKYPTELANTKVQLGGHNFKQEFLRSWNNENQLPVWRHLGALMSLPSGVSSALTRGNNYSPISNTVTLYSKDPAVLRHELGHAVDYNRSVHEPGTFNRQAGNFLYNLIYGIPFVAPYHEAEATRHALNSVKSDPEETRRTWSSLAPAYGTYVGGAAGALAALGLLGDGAAEAVLENPVLAGTALIGGGALAGHGVAAVRNYLADRGRGQSNR